MVLVCARVSEEMSYWNEDVGSVFINTGGAQGTDKAEEEGGGGLNGSALIFTGGK